MRSEKRLPVSAAGPYRNMQENTDEYQLRDLPSTLSMRNATTLAPIAAPMKALLTAMMPRMCSPTKLVPFLSAGAGSTYVTLATTKASRKVVEYISLAVLNEYTRNRPKYSKNTVSGEE